MNQTKIVGKGWEIYVDSDYGLWRGTGEGFEVPLKMLLEHFNSDSISQYEDTSTYLGRQYGMLYPDAAEFLAKWGIKCDVANLPPIIPEAMPLPTD